MNALKSLAVLALSLTASTAMTQDQPPPTLQQRVAMLSTRLPEELSKRVKSIDYVEYTEILGPPAHHIAARGNTVDMQIWIAEGDRPLPLRIVLTYKTEPGQPQFRALLLDWDEKSPAAADAFQFKPPADAQRIMFAVQAKPVTESPAAAAPTGKLP